MSEAERTATFFVQARVQMNVMRELAELIRNTPGQSVQQEMITELVLGIHLLAERAEGIQQHSIALMAAALEGLLRKLLENVANLSASTLQAVVTATDLIQDLCLEEPDADLAVTPPIRALVVDDDPVSLRAMCSAMQMRFSKPESASDGKAAMALAAEKPFDVIFLDVQMPDYDGFEVCTRIRETEANRNTPVVFVTSHQGIELRAKSELCGGNDFLNKSYLSSELNLKALTFALRGRLQETSDAVLLSAS
jgi:PleD family two-component response regulator